MSVLDAENTRNQETLRTLSSAVIFPVANPPLAAAATATANTTPVNVTPTIPTTITYPVTNLKSNIIHGKKGKD